MGYCGGCHLEGFCAKAEFVHVTAAAMHESHPHSITITEEPPNYQMPR